MPIQPHGTKTPIFCVHGGAGTILHLEPLARRLGRRPAVLRAAVPRPLRWRAAAPDGRGDGDALSLGATPGAARRPVRLRRLLLRLHRRVRDGAAHARGGRGGAAARDLQRPEPRLDQALGLVREPAFTDSRPAARRRGSRARRRFGARSASHDGSRVRSSGMPGGGSGESRRGSRWPGSPAPGAAPRGLLPSHPRPGRESVRACAVPRRDARASPANGSTRTLRSAGQSSRRVASGRSRCPASTRTTAR